MKILVFSDSHGKGERMKRIIEKSDCDTVLFLGDGLREFDQTRVEFPDKLFLSVRGNCDGYDGTREEQIMTLDGIRILMLHGHTRGVKHGIEVLEAYGRVVGADLILYGHTHTPDNRYVSDKGKPYYVFNPGSIGVPLFLSPSFGYIETVAGKLVINSTIYKENI